MTAFQPPSGAPSWISDELIAHTISVWQPYYLAPLTTEDALAIILNVAGLVDVLSQGR